MKSLPNNLMNTWKRSSSKSLNLINSKHKEQ